MRSAVWHGGEDIRIEDLPDPELAADDVRIEVAVSAVCGTDVHALHGGFPLFVPPRVLGHEFSGTVVEVGSQVDKVKVGDRVSVEPGMVCNSCWYCRNAQENMCLDRKLSPGAYSSHIVVPSRLVWRLPEGMSFESASMAEPVSCAVHALDLVQMRSGSSVAVIGAGGIGISLMQLSRRSGAAVTILSEPDEHRRQIAKQLGADVVVDPGKQDLLEEIHKATGGLGADVVFEAVGFPPTCEEAIRVAGKGAHIVLVGVNPPDAELVVKPFDLFNRELTISASYMRPYSFGRALRWLNVLDVSPILSPSFPLEQTLDAIHALRDKKGVKPIIRPNQ